MRTFASIDDFCAAVGTNLGESPWMTVDQDQIDTFAEATGDHQWIFLTLSMVPVMLGETFTVDGLQAFMNYGSDRIRFIRPVPAGSRIQASATLTSVEETPMGVRAVVSVEVRLDDDGKPACIADLITLLIR